MLDKVKLVEERYEELNRLMADPEVVIDHVKVTEYAQEQAELQESGAGLSRIPSPGSRTV